jgi:uncharacterized protein
MKFTFNKTEYTLILLNVAGSRLYGNATEKSDYDYRGVFIADKSMHISLNENVEQLGGKTGKGASGEQLCQALLDAGINMKFTDDVVLYEIRRFMELGLDANPNIMDSINFNYTNKENCIYINDAGQKLLDNQSLFMSKKLKHTFSGYAFAQLKKIQSHNKWITEFPDTSKVIKILEDALHIDKAIDFDFIVQNFGGPLAEEITGETAQEHTSINDSYSWDNFVLSYETIDFDLNKYRLPRLYDYTKAFDLKAKPLNKDKSITLINSSTIVHTTSTPKELLMSTGGFRAIGGSIYTIFDMIANKPLGGVYDLNGNVKTHPPKEVGDFRFIAIFDKNEYKKHTDHINNMWHWKIKRNKSRAVLEDEFGYDTKHASHLVRLLLSAMDLIQTGKFVPELSGDTLQIVKDTRAGLYTYETVLTMANEYETKLNDYYASKDCPLPDKPNRVAADKLLIDMINENNR